MKRYEEYFDEEGKQIYPLPQQWIDSSRFKVGDRIRYLPDKQMSNKLSDKVGTVTEVHPGDARGWPSMWSDKFECWVTQTCGWLVVDFGIPQGTITRNGKQVVRTTIACHLQLEGETWEKVT